MHVTLKCTSLRSACCTKVHLSQEWTVHKSEPILGVLLHQSAPFSGVHIAPKGTLLRIVCCINVHLSKDCMLHQSAPISRSARCTRVHLYPGVHVAPPHYLRVTRLLHLPGRQIMRCHWNAYSSFSSPIAVRGIQHRGIWHRAAGVTFYQALAEGLWT